MVRHALPLLCGTLVLGCQAAGTIKPVPAALDTAPLSIRQDIHAAKALALPGQPGRWLLASESSGLSLIDEQDQVLAQYAGSYEALDLRSDVMLGGEKTRLVAALNRDSGAVELFALDTANAAFEKLASLRTGDAQAEAICLHRSLRDNYISLFKVDTLGMIEEHIVYDGKRGELHHLPLRSFVGFPDASGCAVDDVGEHLYVAEEAVAVWRFSTVAESDPSREAVLMMEPFGALTDEITGLSVAADGSLWTLSANGEVHARFLDTAERIYRLDGVEEVESLSVVQDENNGRYQALVFDESAGRFLSASIPATGAPAPRATGDRIPAVPASAETAPVQRFGDAADDPAIWINPDDPARSLILGTDKREGLKLYDLQGKLLLSLPVGRLNNVDLRHGVPRGAGAITLVAASNRSNNSLSFFELNAETLLSHLGDVPTGLSEVYGLCMYQSASGSYVFVNDTDGRYEQYRIEPLEDSAGNNLRAERVREFRLPSQPEGCVADDRNQRLYMGEEGAGVWTSGAEPESRELRMILSAGDVLVPDVEGMAIFQRGDRSLLVVSSQGNDSYAVFGLWDDYPLLGRFRVGPDLARAVDGASETDGLAVTSASLPGYPQGLLVVQDGRNLLPREPQNFKLVDWRNIAPLLEAQAD